MTAVSSELGVRRGGADLLVDIAQQRLSGTLFFDGGHRRFALIFVAGRPQVLLEDGREDNTDRDMVVASLRVVALAIEGVCSFEAATLSEVASRETLRIDTLGEVVVAIIRELPAANLDEMLAARGGLLLSPRALFERFSIAIQRVSGVALERPSAEVSLGSLVHGGTPSVRRSWMGMVLLGGMDVVGELALEPESPQPLQEETHVASSVATDADVEGVLPVVAVDESEAVDELEAVDESEAVDELEAVDESEAVDVAVLSDETHAVDEVSPSADNIDAGALVAEIEADYSAMAGTSHYEILEVTSDASIADIVKAYHSRAKRWHTDRFARHQLGAAEQLANELFVRAEQARRVLTDTEQRREYDYVCRRVASGLPTDPQIILRAEDLFRQAKRLVRAGRSAAAEPVLREAVELNPGEAEFWAYLGWAVYTAKGSKGIDEARTVWQKVEEIDDALDVLHEFRGRMARIEGDDDEAMREFKTALSLNPENADVQRELRLLTVRREQEANAGIFRKFKQILTKS